MSVEKLHEVEQKNCDVMIPTKWNVYRWAEGHAETTIAHALKRMEKIFDLSDSVFFGFSMGKDSTLSAQLACLELHLRKLRVEAGVDRYGNEGVDPLDLKWYGQKLYGMYTDAEICWTSSNDYGKRFLERMGPEGLNLVQFVWVCLPMAWQSGVNFNSGILISWSREWGEGSPEHWVQPLPTKAELHGFEPLDIGNRRTANPVALSSLSPKAQEFHMQAGNVFQCKVKELYGWREDLQALADDPETVLDGEQVVDAVANFGRGPVLEHLQTGCHEKEEQDDHSFYFAETSWLVSSLSEGA